MDLFKEHEKKLKNIEILNLVIYTIYSVNMTLGIIRNQSDITPIIVVFVGLIVSWVVFIVGFKNYRTRALIATIAIEISVCLYALSSDEFLAVLPTVLVISLAVALYGNAGLLGFSALVFLVIIIDVVIKDIINGSGEMVIEIGAQGGNLLFFAVILLVWVIKQNESTRISQKMVAEMEKTEQSKDDFLANVSHEIRTPLNTIYGMTEMIRQETDIDKIKEEGRNIEKASKHLMSLVRDILDFSELQAEDIALEEEVYDITSTVEDIISITKGELEDKNLELVIDFDAAMPKKLMGDEKKLRRIIMNLIDNAIKFTKEGGIVLKFSARKESYGVNLCVSIKDTGIGMKTDNIEKLFSLYDQVDTKRNRQEGGLGLGLAISRLLAQKMGGVISVRSKEGKGSTFTLVVPQKIVDETPSLVIPNARNLFISTFFNLESFKASELRDDYVSCLFNMINQFGVSSHNATSIEELKRRFEKHEYSHIFVSDVEYKNNAEYFDSIKGRTNVVVVYDEKSLIEKIDQIVYMTRPISAIDLVDMINSNTKNDGLVATKGDQKFIAPNAKVLVVDDNAMNIRVVEHLLSNYEIRIERALSGKEALEKIESMDYDFVFMDHMMPEMDGVETFHHIREKYGNYYQTVPIIALTANAVAGSRELFLKEGFNGFIEKPVEILVLDRLLRRTLPLDKIIYVEETKEIKEIKEAKEVSVVTDTSQKMESDKKGDTNMSEFNVEGIDVEAGSMYCGGPDGFFMILAECVLSTEETAKELEALLEAEDWSNYIIKIHALKSTMKSVGAMDLSERARVLEFAGKEGDYEKIQAENAGVVAEYRRLMEASSKQPKIKAELPDGFVFGSKPEDESEENLGEEITEEIMDSLSQKFEDAMYSLDQSVMEEVLMELSTYQRNGHSLKGEMEKLLRKVSQGDFFSAGDSISSLKLQIKGGN